MKGTAESHDDPSDYVELNPFVVFLILFIVPYLLFFGLLMLVTGQTDAMLLYASVVNESNDALIKAWVIGTFALSVVGTLWFSGVQTKQLIQSHLKKSHELVPDSQKTGQTHFVIEQTDDSSVGQLSSKRYARLDSFIDDE